MIQFSDVGLQVGSRVLFEKLNFTLFAREKVGLIGQNGAGKSTLFSMIQGEVHADQGEVQVPKNLRLATVKQETPALQVSALEYVLDGDSIYRSQQKQLSEAEESGNASALGKIHEWMLSTEHYAKPAKAAELLHGLGFSFEEQNKNVAEFSGGWRMRLNLAQALIADSDVLLLDEPTNHLDLEAVLWLEHWLKEYPGILLIISHDREFLDAVVKVILWLDNKSIKRFSGNYSDFERMRAMELQQAEAAFSKQQRERAHLQGFIDRFRAQASKAKQVQSRIKALERIGDALPAYEQSAFQFKFFSFDKANLREVLLALIDADLGYGEQTILREVKFQLAPGQRIGLLGPNGAGKSTLIKALAGEVPVLSGERAVSPHLRLGYFSQHQLDILREEESPFWHIRELSPRAMEPDIRNFLGQFDFRGDKVFDPIEHFSGGEKARLALALIVWQKPNVLLLDEPTNHLDIDMRQALIFALQEYEGALVVISHDRHLLRATTDELYLVYGGELNGFTGSIDDYPAWWKAAQLEAETGSKPQPVAKVNRKDERREAAQKRAAKSEQVKRSQSLEKKLGDIQNRLSEIETALASETLYQPENKLKLDKLLQERLDLQWQLHQTEEEWLNLLAELENSK